MTYCIPKKSWPPSYKMGQDFLVIKYIGKLDRILPIFGYRSSNKIVRNPLSDFEVEPRINSDVFTGVDKGTYQASYTTYS